MDSSPGRWLPLEGVRVADFAMFIPGPFASGALADLGAEVVKVEPPSGDPGRAYIPPQFGPENRNKRSLAVDLKNPSSREIVKALAARSDVVIEGFRPGVAKRLGIDYDALKAHNPRLVYCSISGYGQTGPWRLRPGHDVNYVAAAGALAYSGQWLKAPVRSSIPIADMNGGAYAAIAILSALFETRSTGRGKYLDVSLFESAFFAAALRHGLDPGVDPRAHLFPVNDVFECADGRRLTLGILEQHFWENFVRLEPSLADERFSDDASRRRNGDLLSQRLSEIMKSRTSAEWIEVLEANDVPADLCATPAEAARHAQLVERRAVEEGYPTFPVWADGARGGALRRGAPKLGEHTREILGELGFGAGEIERLVQAKAVKA